MAKHKITLEILKILKNRKKFNDVKQSKIGWMVLEIKFIKEENLKKIGKCNVKKLALKILKI